MMWRKPRPSSPIRFAAGTSSPSKKTSQLSWLIIVSMGLTRTASPASRRSTMNTDSPCVRFRTSASGVVRASRIIRSDWRTREMKTFCPSTT